MKKSLAIALMGASLLVASAAPAQAATPASDYSFSMDGAFSDSIGASTLVGAPTCSSPAPTDKCNVATNFGTDSNGNYWHWRTTQYNGGGATLTTPAQLGGTYSLYFKFAIDDEARDTDALNCDIPEINYSKILHFGDANNDVGLYTEGCGRLYISTGFETGEVAIDLGDVVEVVVTRDDTDDEVTIFINHGSGYSESFVYDDTSGDFVAADSGAGSRIILFQDDGYDAGESTHEGVQEGRLYGMKAWRNTALTLDQLDGLVTVTPSSNSGSGGNAGSDNLANTGGNPAVGGWVLGLALVAGAGAFALRRRNS